MVFRGEVIRGAKQTRKTHCCEAPLKNPHSFERGQGISAVVAEVINYAAVAISQEAGVTLGSFEPGPSSCEAETCGLQLVTEVAIATKDSRVNKRSRHVKRTVVSGQIKTPTFRRGIAGHIQGDIALVMPPCLRNQISITPRPMTARTIASASPPCNPAMPNSQKPMPP